MSENVSYPLKLTLQIKSKRHSIKTTESGCHLNFLNQESACLSTHCWCHSYTYFLMISSINKLYKFYREPKRLPGTNSVLKGAGH